MDSSEAETNLSPLTTSTFETWDDLDTYFCNDSWHYDWVGEADIHFLFHVLFFLLLQILYSHMLILRLHNVPVVFL